MTIPRQLSLGEVIGQIKGGSLGEAPSGVTRLSKARIGRRTIRDLRAKGYGYKRIAGEYTIAPGGYLSHTTVRERLVGG